MTRTEKIEEFLSSLKTEIDVNYMVDAEEVNSYDDVYQQIDDNNGFNIDIIYYSRAMEYLQENDPSLNESLEIASEYGYEPQNLNSEILASLLASKLVREEFYELENEITEFFDELEEEEEGEDL